MDRVIPESTACLYTVKPDDSLASIARAVTGSADYSAIWVQNRSLIGQNPNSIAPGMVLTIPGIEVKTEEDDW
jgi:nucleoid-associated protein YgaU